MNMTRTVINSPVESALLSLWVSHHFHFKIASQGFINWAVTFLSRQKAWFHLHLSQFYADEIPLTSVELPMQLRSESGSKPWHGYACFSHVTARNAVSPEPLRLASWASPCSSVFRRNTEKTGQLSITFFPSYPLNPTFTVLSLLPLATLISPQTMSATLKNTSRIRLPLHSPSSDHVQIMQFK